MKFLIRIYLPALLVFLFGCALFQRGSRAEYNTLASVGYTVDSAVSAYDLGVAKGEISTNSVPLVTKYYNDFQAGYRLALASAEFGTNSIAPQALITKEQTLLNAIGGAK